MTKKKTMKNIKTPNKFDWGGDFKQGFNPAMNNLFSGANMGTGAVGVLGTLGNILEGVISNGFSTKGGAILSGVGDAAMKINPIVGGFIKVASGFVNRSFGTKWNQEGIAKAESQIEGLNNFQSGASDFDALTKDFTKIGSMNKTIKASDLGEDGWLVNRTNTRANELNTNLGNAYNYAMRNANNVSDNIAGSTLANLERNYAAFGGPLFAYGGQTHGSDFTNGLMFINNGGTHESNPYEGVPISMDQEGNPNLVEEGEVIWNDYVFSNRLKVPKSIQKKYKLGKREMTFANAVDKLSKESEERPNDPISMRGLEDILIHMASAQETLKNKKQTTNKNNNKFATGGPAGIYNYEDDYSGYYITPTGNKMAGIQPGVEDIEYVATTPVHTPEVVTDIIATPKNSPTVVRDTLVPSMRELAGLDLSPYSKNGKSYYEIPQAVLDIASKINLNKENPSEQKGESIKNLPTWMRYAPAIGHGALALTDMLGITNKPNYSNAEAIIKASNNLSSNPIKFKPIGDYLTYNPFDTEYHANQLRAVSGATRRNVMNTSGGNRATAMTGILASDNNTMNQLGDLYRKAAEYNLDQKHKVGEFNRGTNQFNSEGFFKADAANQSMRQAGLEGLIRGYTMKEQANLMSDQAKAANISGLLTSLGNIGYENANRNMMNWGMATGTWAPSQWKYDPLTGKPVNQNG